MNDRKVRKAQKKKRKKHVDDNHDYNDDTAFCIHCQCTKETWNVYRFAWLVCVNWNEGKITVKSICKRKTDNMYYKIYLSLIQVIWNKQPKNWSGLIQMCQPVYIKTIRIHRWGYHSTKKFDAILCIVSVIMYFIWIWWCASKFKYILFQHDFVFGHIKFPMILYFEFEWKFCSHIKTLISLIFNAFFG